MHSIPISHSKNGAIAFDMNQNMTAARWQPANNSTMQNQSYVINNRINTMGGGI